MAPIKGKYYQTQGYGLTQYALSPAGKKAYKNFPGGIHPGIDFGSHGINLEVQATVGGRIVRASLDGGWGNHVELEGYDGWRRQYAHLSTISCKVGQEVKPGTVLGRMGSTGVSSGVHLHAGSRKLSVLGRWQYRDPSPDFLDEAPQPPQPITSKLIKANDVQLPRIYVYNGRMKFHVPDMETLLFLFADTKYELVDPATLAKIPEGPTLVSLK